MPMAVPILRLKKWQRRLTPCPLSELGGYLRKSTVRLGKRHPIKFGNFIGVFHVLLDCKRFYCGMLLREMMEVFA